MALIDSRQVRLIYNLRWVRTNGDPYIPQLVLCVALRCAPERVLATLEVGSPEPNLRSPIERRSKGQLRLNILLLDRRIIVLVAANTAARFSPAALDSLDEHFERGRMLGRIRKTNMRRVWNDRITTRTWKLSLAYLNTHNDLMQELCHDAGRPSSAASVVHGLAQALTMMIQ